MCKLCVQLGSVGYKHAGSDHWASHSTWDNSFWGNVTCLLHGKLGSAGAPVVCGGVRGDAGTAILLRALAAVRSRDCECQINRERLRYQASAVSLQRDAGCRREGELWGRAQRCFKRPSGRQRRGSGLVRLGCWWSRAGYGVFWSIWKQVEGLPLAMGPAASQQDGGGGVAGAPIPAWCRRAV